MHALCLPIFALTVNIVEKPSTCTCACRHEHFIYRCPLFISFIAFFFFFLIYNSLQSAIFYRRNQHCLTLSFYSTSTATFQIPSQDRIPKSGICSAEQRQENQKRKQRRKQRFCTLLWLKSPRQTNGELFGCRIGPLANKRGGCAGGNCAWQEVKTL